MVNEYTVKENWKHPNVADPKRLELESAENQFNCFEDGFSCQVIINVGIGTLQGLISKADTVTKENKIHLNNGLVFIKEEWLPENMMLSQAQAVYLLRTLLEVGVFYKNNGRTHGDFNPWNVSKIIYRIRYPVLLYR